MKNTKSKAIDVVKMNNLHLFRYQVILSFFTTIVIASREVCRIGELNSPLPNRKQGIDSWKPKNWVGIIKRNEEQTRETEVSSRIGNTETQFKSIEDSFVGYKKAHDFLRKCKSKFVGEVLSRSTDDRSNLDAILEKLSLKTPKSWEDFAESTNLQDSLKIKESRNNLIECADTCEEKHEDAETEDWWIRKIDGYGETENRRKRACSKTRSRHHHGNITAPLRHHHGTDYGTITAQSRHQSRHHYGTITAPITAPSWHHHGTDHGTITAPSRHKLILSSKIDCLRRKFCYILKFSHTCSIQI